MDWWRKIVTFLVLIKIYMDTLLELSAIYFSNVCVKMGFLNEDLKEKFSTFKYCAEQGDELAMLHLGKIQWTGPVKNLTESNDPFVDQFIHGRATGPIEAVR